MSGTPPVSTAVVDYKGAARRHLIDATRLLANQRPANAGQLFGFSVECGLKALLVATGEPSAPDGGLPSTSAFRRHLPHLGTLIAAMSTLPDGRMANGFQAYMPSLAALQNWSIDHRYWRESAMPLASLPNWELAAMEVDDMLDKATADGVL